MSKQIWNIHNYSEPPQQHQENPKPPAYQPANGVLEHTSADKVVTRFNENFRMPVQTLIRQRPSCMFIENQTIRNRVQLNSWRQNASIEDWEAYLYSAPSSSVNIQTPVVSHTQMTPYSYNVETSSSDPNLRRFSQDHSQFNILCHHQTLNGAYKAAVNETRHRALSSAVENKRVIAGRSQSNNARASAWYHNRSEQKRGREKSQYYNFSPELIRYVDPMQLERELRSDLEYVELLMCNAHQNGYVTLDEKAMSILVNAIDKALPKNLNLRLLAESVFNN